MTIYYAGSSVRSFSPDPSICKGHNKPVVNDKNPVTGKVHMSINCAKCAPLLESQPGWVTSPENVPLTEEEESSLKAREHEANKAMGVFGAEMFEAFQEFMQRKQSR